MTDFEDLRPRLFGIAYRILGVVADAEDVVQETWIAWNASDQSQIASPTAYLTRAVSNRSLNRLREQRRRREDYIGPWLPEPIDTARRPDEAVELADSVSYALMVLLEQLTPLERAAFVLREVFDVPTTEVAEALSSNPNAVRKLVSRARAHLAEQDRSYVVDPDEHQRVAADFLAALQRGDVARATELLAPDVQMINDSGGVVAAARRPILGVDKVARLLFGLASKFAFTAEVADVNGLPGVVVRGVDGTDTALQFGVIDGQVAAIWAMRNPAKLTDHARRPGESKLE